MSRNVLNLSLLRYAILKVLEKGEREPISVLAQLHKAIGDIPDVDKARTNRYFYFLLTRMRKENLIERGEKGYMLTEKGRERLRYMDSFVREVMKW